MAQYIDIADLAQAAGFRTRVMVAMVEHAGQVLAESTTYDDGGTSRTRSEDWAEKRLALAQQTLLDPVSMIGRFIWSVIANPTIADKGVRASDADILFQVTQIWDAVAGVTRADKTAP